MQLRLVTGLTEAEYVSSRAWERASVRAYPLHGEKCCSFSRHGTYVRMSVHREARIARWYCRKSPMTFSLLPERLASGMPGSLSAMEEAVARLEADPAVTAVALQEHADPRVGAKTARRWLQRRKERVHAALGTAKGLVADQLRDCVPTVPGLRGHFGQDGVLMLLCIWCAEQGLPKQPPVGVYILDWVAPKEVHFSLRSRQQSMAPIHRQLLAERMLESAFGEHETRSDAPQLIDSWIPVASGPGSWRMRTSADKLKSRLFRRKTEERERFCPTNAETIRETR